MKAPEIKGWMLLKGIQVKDIAKNLKVSPTTVSVVITGRGKSRRIQLAVCKAINRTFEQVWGNKNG